MEHLLLLVVGDPGRGLELAGGHDPAPVVPGRGAVGGDAAPHQLGRVVPRAVEQHGAGVAPDDPVPEVIGGEAGSGAVPDDIEGSADRVPGAAVAGVEVGDHSVGKFNQRKAQEGHVEISGYLRSNASVRSQCGMGQHVGQGGLASV